MYDSTTVRVYECTCVPVSEGGEVEYVGIPTYSKNFPKSDVFRIKFSHTLDEMMTCTWAEQGFPENKKENRGSPALCVSGNFQGKQRVLGLHSGNSLFSLSLRAGLGQNLRQN